MKCNENIRLVGQNIILVPYERSHVPKYHSWMQDSELRQLTASEPLSLDAEFDMQKKWREDEDKLTFIILSKQILDDGWDEIGSMVGDVNLFLTKSDDASSGVTAELEIMIAEKAWRGRGLGREAVVLMILYAIDHLHIGKFQVKVGSGNVSSLKLFECLGFRRVGFSEVFDEITLALDYSVGGDCFDMNAVVSQWRDRYSYCVDAYRQD